MTQPNLERSDLHHLRVGQAVRDTGQECALIKVAAHHVDIGRQRFQVVKRELVDQVACAEDVCNLAWDKKRLELLRQVGLAVRDVHVADDEHEHHCVG
eukprot:CAMPEP_0181204764 /NCGR_PEP_ID=MMETSP1096-20121128/20111_1 /TAXON_ID=156174 ORGANISM="Chrysochromulina ericina, Strain CCMP281" /NCGR_SAMPLE_ID=MMETSP1096 /ASSEMBLY_ACC=CAM_ASM_000453 /LENGTH=97 /DNA_ID=CAMNT_0023295489 /DNA_START=967 /DNA_END=1257 /DNA_ORIENTATION=-